ncbi:hypothetical protein FAZ19_01015 [Sphingobacterium alkalisoli]|uniref:Lipoprotein n=1 Tax=Sphingobacterium alkalisoli TaxID=1874115 RepID=A0A4U0H7P6_9SPHI|nr:hypothetical protein [Sphingobacterium alkalisoli]TJY67875.1 hypothetical protein FAZ19_01015 [Sphingobacterium alkalisoli]
MKSLFFTISGVLILLSACNQNKSKEQETQDSTYIKAPQTMEEVQQLSEVVTRFVRAYINQDNEKANALIHPKLGFTVIHRPGVADVFTKVDSIDFGTPVPAHFPYPTFSNDYVLTFETLPTFDCGTEKWSKEGFFCDTTAHPDQLSRIALFQREFNQEEFSDAEIDAIKNAERKSYRVILTAKDPLIFHLQHEEGVWYITVLDRAYAGCDA